MQILIIFPFYLL